MCVGPEGPVGRGEAAGTSGGETGGVGIALVVDMRATVVDSLESLVVHRRCWSE